MLKSNKSTLALLLVLVSAGIAFLVLIGVLFPGSSEVNVFAGEQVVFNVSRLVDLAYVEVVLSTPSEVQFSDKPPQHNMTTVTQEMDSVLSYGGSFGVSPRTFDRVVFDWNTDACQFVNPLSLDVDFRTYQVNCSGRTNVSRGFVPGGTDGNIVPLLTFDTPSSISFVLKSNIQQSIKMHVNTTNYVRRYFFASSSVKRSPFGTEPIKYPVKSQHVYGIVNAQTDLKVQLRVVVTFWGGVQSVVYAFLATMAGLVAFFLGMFLLLVGIWKIGPEVTTFIVLAFLIFLIYSIFRGSKKQPTPPKEEVVDHEDEEMVSKV